MTSLKQPTGLIRFDSVKGIEKGEKFKFRPRNTAYMVVLVILIGIFATLIATKSDVEAVVVRTYNTVYQERPDGRISNMYNYKIINKTSRELPMSIKLDSPDGEIQIIGSKAIVAEGGEIKEGTFFVIFDKDKIQPKMKIQVGVYSNELEIDKTELSFVGPM